MTKTNLTKRSTITVNEFRSWLNQLIQDKKGALPDLSDWKLIKEQLDKVDNRKIEDDASGYSILRNDNDCIGFDPEDYAFACGGIDDNRCIGYVDPYDMEFFVGRLDRLCHETESEYANAIREWHSYYNEYANSVPACALREDKEYTDGKTKTKSDTNTSTSNT